MSNFNYPSVDINVIDEIKKIYEELIYVKRNQCEYQFKLKKEYFKTEKLYNNKILNLENKIIILNKLILVQNSKIIILEEKLNIINN